MKGMLFSDDMANAIVDGRKSQTRRPIKGADAAWELHNYGTGGVIRNIDSDQLSANFNTGNDGSFFGCVIPLPYKLDQVLYVKERWQAQKCFDSFRPSDIDADAKINFLARPIPSQFGWGKVRSSLFMCERHARSLIVVKGVRIERLNQISHDDCLCEGFACVSDYAHKWESLYGIWAFDNRWVAVNDFEALY